MRRIGAVVVGVAMVAVLSGWGTSPVTPHGEGHPAATRAVRALTGANTEGALAAMPPDFAAVIGYRPVIIDPAGQRMAGRGDGGCSSPIGAAPLDFWAVCARHDLGYDLLRYAAFHGDPLGGWARRAIDDQFADGLVARCREQPGNGLMRTTATLYTAVVQVNSWRQGDAAPLTEDGWRWAASLTAALCVGLGITRRPHQSPRTGSGGRAIGMTRIRTLDPAGALVAVLAAVLSLGPSLLHWARSCRGWSAGSPRRTAISLLCWSGPWAGGSSRGAGWDRFRRPQRRAGPEVRWCWPACWVRSPLARRRPGRPSASAPGRRGG